MRMTGIYLYLSYICTSLILIISTGSVSEDDFNEYLWMENEEEFEKSEMLRLEEEEEAALMEECLEAMMLQAEIDDHDLDDDDSPAEQNDSNEFFFWKVLIEQSTLNPDSPEFVPVSN